MKRRREALPGHEGAAKGTRPEPWRRGGAGAYVLHHFGYPRGLVWDVDHYIYVLRDPRDGGVRYVGRTRNLKRRYGAHLYRTEDGSFVHDRRDWVLELRAAGLRPLMEVVETLSAPVAEALVSEREHRWVFHLFKGGARLTNVDCIRMPRLYAAARDSKIDFLAEALASPAWKQLAALRKEGLEEWGRINRALWDELEGRMA